jgi:DNA-directed RNA polymerase specialized sigma24 family protein
MGLRPEFVRARRRCLTRRYPKLITLLLSLGFPPDVVQEAAQDAVLAALETLQDGTVRSLRQRWPWLKTVAIHRASAICRDRSRHFEPVQTLEEDVTTPSPIEEWVVRETVRSEVRRLPVKYREVVTYRYLEDHSHAETMVRFNLTDGALRRRLESARFLLWLRLKNGENSARCDAPGAPK